MRPRTRGGTSLKKSESEILNDPEIWMVTESQDDDASSDDKYKTDDQQNQRKGNRGNEQALEALDATE